MGIPGNLHRCIIYIQYWFYGGEMAIGVFGYGGWSGNGVRRRIDVKCRELY
jgi:hypothetical protein